VSPIRHTPTDESARGRRNVRLAELESLEADALTTLPVGPLQGRRDRLSHASNPDFGIAISDVRLVAEGPDVVVATCIELPGVG
jgi:hypothetical protein